MPFAADSRIVNRRRRSPLGSDNPRVLPLGPEFPIPAIKTTARFFVELFVVVFAGGSITSEPRLLPPHTRAGNKLLQNLGTA